MDAVSLHRRLYRLALLLTGRPERADAHARTVAAAAIRRRPRHQGRPRLGPDSADRLERQVLLACRRDAATDARLAPGFGRLGGLPVQFREAFVLVRVLGRSLREAARAMDCSRTAVRRHLQRADAALLAGADAAGERQAGLDRFVDELRRDLQSMPDAPVFTVREVAAPRRRRLRVAAILLAAGALILLAWRGWALWGPSGGAAPGTTAPSSSSDAPAPIADAPDP